MDNEIKGVGNSLNYKYRMHDPRLGRFFAIDPLALNYPYYTPYSFSGNKVIAFGEIEGLEEGWIIKDNKIVKVEGPANEVLNSFQTQELAEVALSLDLKTPKQLEYAVQISEYLRKQPKPPYTPPATIRQEPTMQEKYPEHFPGYVMAPQMFIAGKELVEDLAIGGIISKGAKVFNKLYDIISLMKKEKYAGGAYGRIENVYKKGRNITKKNHIPSKQAYKNANLKITEYSATAHLMDKIDHRLFITTGSSKEAIAFRNMEAKLLEQGKYLEAFDLNAKYLEILHGNKYKKAIKEAREHFINEVIPKLKKQTTK